MRPGSRSPWMSPTSARPPCWRDGDSRSWRRMDGVSRSIRPMGRRSMRSRRCAPPAWRSARSSCSGRRSRRSSSRWCGEGLMRPRDRARFAAALLAALALGAGCARPAGPPPIRPGAACDACGMEVHDLRFACEREASNTWRVYDAIECLIRDAAGDSAVARVAWLSDYDRRTLGPAPSLWVVRGSFPTPMGGGYAAFGTRASADSIAAVTGGRVERLAAWLAEPVESAP